MVASSRWIFPCRMRSGAALGLVARQHVQSSRYDHLHAHTRLEYVTPMVHAPESWVYTGRLSVRVVAWYDSDTQRVVTRTIPRSKRAAGLRVEGGLHPLAVSLEQVDPARGAPYVTKHV